jgi:ABC-2 type transport system ATP-binding protein
LDIKDVLDVQVRKLSLGQRMKCELVAALLHKPKVLFLDEPTIGLDVVAQKNIRDFIKEYNRKNKTTILLTSHYMEDVKELCERVIIIDEGRIIYDGNLGSLIEKYAPYKVLKISFEGEGVKKEDVEKYGNVTDFQPSRITLQVDREKAKDVAREILSSDLPVDDILIDEVEISDVVRKIFSNNAKK